MVDEKEIKVDVEETLDEDETMTPMESFFYHQRRALEETGKALEALLPPDFRKHGAEATREFSQGFRILVDAAIDELKKVSEKDIDDTDDNDGSGDNDDKPPSTGKSKVKVDVD